MALALALVAQTGCTIYLMRVHTDQELREYDLPEAFSGSQEDLRTFFDELAPLQEEDARFIRCPTRVKWVRKGEERRAAREEDRGTGQQVFSFVHLSDVQLRDERARLWTLRGSRFGDLAVPSFQHDEVQMRYDYALYLATIETLNRLGDSEECSHVSPELVVHTGDALDAQTTEELKEFLAITERLDLPFLQAIGNHDANVFGNFQGQQIYLGNPMAGNLVVNGTDDFAMTHQGGDPMAADPGLERDLAALHAKYGVHLPLAEDLFGFHRHEETIVFLNEHLDGDDEWRGHGLTIRKNDPADPDLPYYAGYYAVPLALDGGGDGSGPSGIRLVVLNTYETSEGDFGRWHEGRMSRTQLDWLRAEIEDAKDAGELVLAFGHHPVTDAFASDETAEFLRRQFRKPHVLAYFAGHTHRYGLHHHAAEDAGFGFWEVVTAGLVEYPQDPSIVTLRRLESGWAIDLQSLCIQPPPNGEYVPCAFDEAEASLLERAWCARYGAEEDTRHKDFWTRVRTLFRDPTEIDDSLRNVRLMVPVQP